MNRYPTAEAVTEQDNRSAKIVDDAGYRRGVFG